MSYYYRKNNFLLRNSKRNQEKNKIKRIEDS